MWNNLKTKKVWRRKNEKGKTRMGSGANVIRERKKVMREGEGGLRKWLKGSEVFSYLF